jgi:hypothetical protein
MEGLYWKTRDDNRNLPLSDMILFISNIHEKSYVLKKSPTWGDFLVQKHNNILIDENITYWYNSHNEMEIFFERRSIC